MTAPPILWSPDGDRVEHATITGYTRWLEQTRGLDLPDYQSLWVVDDRHRGLLGVDPGAIRRDRLATVRPGARVANHAGRRVVPGRTPQLCRARASAA